MFESLCVMSNVRVFAEQDGLTDGQPAGRTHTTHYIDPYDTHMNQNERGENKRKEENHNISLCLNIYTPISFNLVR